MEKKEENLIKKNLYNRRMDGKMDRKMSGWIDGRMDGWMSGKVKREMDVGKSEG